MIAAPDPAPMPTTSLPGRIPLWHTTLPLGLVLAAGLFAWWGVTDFGFLFDDEPAIRGNDPLLAGDWWNAAFGPRHQPLANRPLACLSLVLDLAVFGPGPFGPHLGNLLLHLANGMLLFLLVRGTLRAPNLAGRFDPAAAGRLGLAIACVWVVHPLATDSVAYATQRSTLLASGFLLLALGATLRAHGVRAPLRWRAVAVAAMALGMASKEDLVAGPLLVLLYERAFLLPDWRSLRVRAGFHAAMAATWLVLASCVALGPGNPTVGYATRLGTTAWQWLLTQAGVVAWYVRLALWPDALRGAYDQGVVDSLGPAVLPGAFVLALLGLTAWCWRRWPWWGWLGALFFLWLAPTSTVLPIVTEVVAERRAYLPMLAVIVPVLFGARALLSRLPPAAARGLGAVLACGAVIALGLAARRHAATYADETAFWQHAFDARDPQSRTMLAAQILSNQGSMLYRAGRGDEAAALFDLAMSCDHPTYVERTHWAVSLQARGRHAEAVAALEVAIAEAPDWAESHGTLGTCLMMEFEKAPQGPGDPRLLRAVGLLRRAVELAPRRVVYWNSLGGALQRQERFAEAEAAFRRATELPFERSEPFLAHASVLFRLGRPAEANRLLQDLLARRPRDVPLRLELVRRAVASGDRDGAMALLRDVLRIDPAHAQAAQALRELEAAARR